MPNSRTIWIIIFIGWLITYSLRAAPFLLSRFFTDESHPRAERFLEFCSYAIVGSMMGEAIFSPQATAFDSGLRVAFTALGFGSMLLFKRQLTTFFLVFGAYAALQH